MSRSEIRDLSSLSRRPSSCSILTLICNGMVSVGMDVVWNSRRVAVMGDRFCEHGGRHRSLDLLARGCSSGCRRARKSGCDVGAREANTEAGCAC